MKPTRFRAYAIETAESRRVIAGKKENVLHDVENPAFEGRVVDGKVTFDAGDTKITRVVLYGGPVAEEVVVGDLPLDRSGKISVEYVEATDDEEAKIVEA